MINITSQYQNPILNDVTVPVSTTRSLLQSQLTTGLYIRKSISPVGELFTDITDELKKEASGEGQGGEGVLDLVKAGLDVAKNVAPKVALAVLAATAAKKIGTAVTTGKIGTKITNIAQETFSKNPNARPKFSGEAHMLLPTKYGITLANYCGPGTNLLERIRRKDPGVDGPNGVDIACKAHDILYMLAKTPEDLRRADDRLISDVGKSSQGPKTKALIINLIKAKKFGEDIGAFGPETFTKLKGLSGTGRQGPPPGILFKQSMMDVLNKKPYRMGGIGIIDSPSQEFNPAGTGIIPSKRDVQKLIKDLPPLPADRLREELLEDLNIGVRKGKKLVSVVNKVAGKKIKDVRKILKGGQFGLLASLAASFIVPQIIKAFTKKKGKGLNPAGAGLRLAGAGTHLAGGQLKPKDLIKLLSKSPLLTRKLVQSLKHKKLKKQKGGQFGLLASLAASFIVPEIIKLFKKK